MMVSAALKGGTCYRRTPAGAISAVEARAQAFSEALAYIPRVWARLDRTASKTPITSALSR